MNILRVVMSVSSGSKTLVRRSESAKAMPRCGAQDQIFTTHFVPATLKSKAGRPWDQPTL
jgi:hypothetical protein